MIIDHEYWAHKINSRNLVDKAILNSRVFALKWVPFLDEQTDLVSSYCLAFNDKTEEDHIAQKAIDEEKKRKKSLDIVSQLLSIPKPRFKEFFDDVNSRLEEIVNLLENDQLDFERIFIHLHTIKGSARLYKFSYLVAVAKYKIPLFKGF